MLRILSFAMVVITGFFTGEVAVRGIAFAAQNASAAPRVVVSIAPVHSIAAAVMAGIGEPRLLLNKSISPHEFSLKPSQARALQRADLVIWVGPGMELPLKGPLQGLSQSSKVLGLQERRAAASAQKGRDPHFWLDPQEALWIADLIAQRLAQLDPAKAAQYRQNAANFKLDVHGAEKSARESFAGLEEKPLMVFHDAFGSFVDRFGLNLAGVVQSAHSVRPGVATIAALREKMVKGEIACLSSEFGEHSPLVEVLLEDTSIKTVELDLMGAKIATGSRLYPKLIISLAKDLADCLK